MTSLQRKWMVAFQTISQYETSIISTWKWHYPGASIYASFFMIIHVPWSYLYQTQGVASCYLGTISRSEPSPRDVNWWNSIIDIAGEVSDTFYLHRSLGVLHVKYSSLQPKFIIDFRCWVIEQLRSQSHVPRWKTPVCKIHVILTSWYIKPGPCGCMKCNRKGWNTLCVTRELQVLNVWSMVSPCLFK